MEQISVLVVDDSALMRNLICKIIDRAPDLTVAGRAMNGHFALEKLPRLKPDLIVLDLEMPEMNGIEFLAERKKRGIDIPVLILSSHAQRGARVTMDALSLGAAEFIMKPSGEAGHDVAAVAAQLVELVRAYGGEYRRRSGKTPPPRPPAEARAEPPAGRPGAAGTTPSTPVAEPRRTGSTGSASLPARSPGRSPGPMRVIALGISTGGPNALRRVLPAIPQEMDLPMLIVQHMPAGFTAEFANSLSRICNREVKEAADGDIVKPGRILIAPGDRHMRVERRSLADIIRIGDDDPVNGHRPSADVLFQSVARAYAHEALAVIMTGMGRDGAREIGTVYEAGGFTIGQDESSSVVYGMPKVAWEAGYLHRQVALEDMAEAIHETVGKLAEKSR